MPKQTLPAGGARKGFFYGYVIVATVLLIDMILAGIHVSYGVFFKPLSEEFGWTRAATSGAFTLYNMVHGALFIVTGRINDRFGPRLLLAISGFFLGLGYILMSRVGAIWQLYFFYGGIVALGMSGGFVPLLSTIARWFGKRRGLMTGLVLAGGGIGQSVLPPLTSWLIATFDWRTAYIIVAVAVFVMVVLLAQLLRRDPQQMGQLPDGGDGEAASRGAISVPIGLSLRQALSTRQFWLYCLAIFFTQFGIGTMLVHSVPYGIGLGMSPTGAASIMTTFAAVGIASRIISGVVVDRIGGKRVLAVTALLIAIGLLGIAGNRTIWGLYAFAAVFGLGFGGLVSAMSPLAAQLFGLTSHGVIFGVLTFGATFGAGIGPLVAGGIFDVSGEYTLAFIVAGVLSLGSFGLALLLRPAVEEHT